MTPEQFTALLHAFEPLYFMLGVITGLLVMLLFKGRWFV